MTDNDAAAQAARSYLANLSDEAYGAFLDGVRTARTSRDAPANTGSLQRGRDIYRQQHDPKWVQQAGPGGHQHHISV